jgi:hemoglobin
MPETDVALLADVTEESIALLIDRFYGRIRRDPMLAKVFEGAIAPEDWPEHLTTMQRFWSSVMLASGRYSGNPLAVHLGVHGLERPMFAHWLALFDETVRELFASEMATLFAAKARRIAASLELAVFHTLDGRRPDGLHPPLGETSTPPSRGARCD